MATKSIYKNIAIKDRHLARGLIRALENAEKKTSREIVISKKHHSASDEEIRKIFGSK